MSLQDIRALQGISSLECLHCMFKRHDDPDFILGEREQTIKLQHTNLDHSDCKVLGYNIANSKQMWNLEQHDCCIDKDCMQTLMATEHGRAFDYIKSMDLSNNHQLGDQGATVLGKLYLDFDIHVHVQYKLHSIIKGLSFEVLIVLIS